MTISNFDAVTEPQSGQYLSSKQLSDDGVFINARPLEQFTVKKMLSFIKRAMFERKVNTVPVSKIPVQPITSEIISALPNDKTSVIRLGHSSLFIKISNQRWLVDPVFANRASPFSFMGPKRFHSTPISLDDLPAVDGVIISHNHYDHMDKSTLQRLNETVKHFVLPIGNGKQLQAWGIDAQKIIELDWWQSVQLDSIKLVSTPAQHFSGRGLGDRDKALWSSWVIASDESTLFFSGDSGYFDGFKAIGKRYGPFDLTLMECGAYDSDWSDVHMTPQESAQAHRDLDGRTMLPIHNGTFDLAFHAWTDPFEQIVDIAYRVGIDLVTPTMGQVFTLDDALSVAQARNNFWWRAH